MLKVREVTHRRAVKLDVVSGIPGYRAFCRCGWRGPWRTDRDTAHGDFELHEPPPRRR
jgi:hypothetical protein